MFFAILHQPPGAGVILNRQQEEEKREILVGSAEEFLDPACSLL